LRRQYSTIALVGIVIFLVVGYFLGWLVAVGFAVGAVLSGSAGFIGMDVSVGANVRAAQAAIGSLGPGLVISFCSRGRPRPRGSPFLASRFISASSPVRCIWPPMTVRSSTHSWRLVLARH